MLDTIIYLLIGAVFGAAIAYLWLKQRLQQTLHQQELVLSEAGQQQDFLQERLKETEEAFQQSREELKQTTKTCIELEKQVELAQAEMATKQRHFEQLRKEMELQFERRSHKIFEEKQQLFKSQSEEQIKTLLQPMRDRLDAVKKVVEEAEKNQLKERTSLMEQIKQLSERSMAINASAERLTKAFKGDNKAQGNWGEVILEKVLESSGLQKDLMYQTQVSESLDGKRLQPDVVVLLPDGRKIVIDSKVSLVDYERSIDSDEAQIHLKAHAASVRTHIKGLANKRYDQLYGIESLDFVLLFIPIEAAFMSALQHDPSLYDTAFKNRIILVSPTTLLATLKTINEFWKYDLQNKNVEEIAHESGKMLDKFVGFVKDMEDIGKRLNSTQTSYDAALNKLNTGTGNLIRRAHVIKNLGAKITKTLPEEL